jgi:SAM-dependent methyltransferase
MPCSPSSRQRLSPRDVERFASTTLFDRVGRTLCNADCLPRKELFESWEVARRVRRRFRGGRVVDLACGHGLLGQLMLLLDDTSPSVVSVDTRMPASARAVAEAMAAEWPRLARRVAFVEGAMADVTVDAGDLIVSAHACGALTDDILTKALSVRARVAVLPCCHDAATCDTGHLEGWMDAAIAIDVTRAARLTEAGYHVRTQLIPQSITPKNRLLLGDPLAREAP